jgi:hypothetical protein
VGFDRIAVELVALGQIFADGVGVGAQLLDIFRRSW